MSKTEQNYLEILVKLDKVASDREEFNNLLQEAPPVVKEAFEIIVENRPAYLKQVVN